MRAAEPCTGLMYPVEAALPDDVPEPDYFGDANLDQIVSKAVGGAERYNLVPLYRARARDVATVNWRQGVFRDLEKPAVRAAVVALCDGLSATRSNLALSRKLHDAHHSFRWHLNAIDTYVETVESAVHSLGEAEVASPALSAFVDWLTGHVAAAQFSELVRGARGLLHELGEIRYDILVRGAKVVVGHYDEELDYSAEVLHTFERFRQGAVQRHKFDSRRRAEMDSIEAAVLNLVAALHPDLFRRVEAFVRGHAEFIDSFVARVDRELNFYLSWLGYVAPLRDAGMAVTYPRVDGEDKTLNAVRTFDLALATKLAGDSRTVVVNDIALSDAERILVVSGPNQGGKTTLARTFLQLYHLASLGLPVAGEDVRLHLPDDIFSHFEREENLDTLAGKLEDEVRRVRDILAAVTGRSVVVMNEMFNSTTVADARTLSERVLTTLTEVDAVCLCVTFIDELSRLNEKTVSMESTVDERDPAIRTFKVIRKPADGRAYALAIARKYGLTFDTLQARIESNA